MKWPAAVIAILAVSFTTPVFSGPAPTPAPHPEAQRRISLNYRGPLREAVKRVADDAKLNVVVRGDLDEEGDFHFENVPAQEALGTLASAYNLVLEQHGSVFTLRPLTGPEEAMQAVQLKHSGTAHPSMLVPPMPPIPPLPSFTAKDKSSDDEADSEEDSDSDSDSGDDDR